MLTFRPATLDDAKLAADIETALFPDEPESPAAVRHWWATVDPAWTVERWVALAGAEPVGIVARWHKPWAQMKERFGGVRADLFPAWRTPERLAELYEQGERANLADGTAILTTEAREDDALKLRFLEERGYREERRARAWELDLVANAAKLRAVADRSRARMREQGIRILTLAEDRDPEVRRKLWRCDAEASQDVPRTVPWTPRPFEIFERWFTTPGFHADRCWLARVADEVVGVSVLTYPVDRGEVWTDWTGTSRSVRGKGVARALKLETVLQAMDLGTTRVRTDNDSRNAPILHINEDMGYVRIPGEVQLMKKVAGKT